MLKKINLFILLSATGAFAQINFENSLQETFNKAKKEQKNVFIEFYNETCSVCKKVNPLLETKEVGEIYNALFTSYKINTHVGISEQDKAFLDKHKLFFKDVPNFIYFSANEEFLHYAGGKADIEYIKYTAGEALNPAKQTSTLAKRVANGDKSVKTLYEYSFLAQLHEDYPLVNEIADQMFSSFSKDKLGNNSSFYILKNSVYTTKNGFFDFFVHNQNMFSGLDTGSFKGKEVDVLKNIISIDLTNDKLLWDDLFLEKMHQYMVATNYSIKPEVLLIDKRLKIFDVKNNQHLVSEYLEPLLLNSKYSLDDKIYILEQLKEGLKKYPITQLIKKEAKKLTDLTKDPETLKRLYNLSK